MIFGQNYFAGGMLIWLAFCCVNVSGDLFTGDTCECNDAYEPLQFTITSTMTKCVEGHCNFTQNAPMTYKNMCYRDEIRPGVLAASCVTVKSGIDSDCAFRGAAQLCHCDTESDCNALGKTYANYVLVTVVSMCTAFCRIEVRLAWAAIGSVICFSASIVWLAVYSNVASGVCALVASVYAALLFTLHLLYWRQRLDDWSPTLFMVTILSGTLGQLGGIIAIIAFIALGIVNHTDFHDFHGDNWWLSIVWAWMIWKWAFQLFWYARKYRKECEPQYMLEKGISSPNTQNIIIRNDTGLTTGGGIN